MQYRPWRPDTAIRLMLHEERRARFIQHIVTEDAELLHRLAQ
jgi:hypothetical protein